MGIIRFVKELQRREIRLSDGRYLIYYTVIRTS